MRAAKLSIVTPTLNCGDFLEQTAFSIRPLMREGAEWIVVDSGSTDSTVDIAQLSGAQVHFFPKGNMYAAINEGLLHAEGEWLTYINGDDWIYADAALEMLETMADTADVLYGNLDYIDPYNRFLFYWRSSGHSSLRINMSCYCGILQQGVLFRREVAAKLNGFDTQYRFCGDYDFFLRAVQEGFRFCKYTRKSIGAFRLIPSQLSQSQKGDMAPEGERIRARLWENQPKARRLLFRCYSFLYRNTVNIDSRIIRHFKGMKLDNRGYGSR